MAEHLFLVLFLVLIGLAISNRRQQQALRHHGEALVDILARLRHLETQPDAGLPAASDLAPAAVPVLGAAVTIAEPAPPGAPAFEAVPAPEPVVRPDPSPPESAARPAFDLERLLTVRWSVWVGGLALALGGIYLVKFSIDAGLFGPRLRVAAAGLLGLALLGLAELLRRRAAGEEDAATIPAVLAAAGTVTLFGAVYAAHALYGLLGPGTAFLLLALVALAAFALSLRHAGWLAGVGLVGAYLAPLLVETRDPAPWVLTSYVLGVAALGAVFGQVRRAPGLVAFAHLLALPFAALESIAAFDFGVGPAGLALLFGLVALAFVTLSPDRFGPRGAGAIRAVGPFVLGAMTLFILLVAAIGDMEGRDAWIAGGLVALLAFGGALLNHARAASILSGLAAVAAAMLVGALAAGETFVALPPLGDIRVPRLPAVPPLVFGMGVAVAAFPLARLLARPIGERRATLLALVATLTLVALFAVMWLRVAPFERRGDFAIAAAILASLHALVSPAFVRRGLGGAANVAAAGAIAFVAAALATALDGWHLSLGLAGAGLIAAWHALRHDLSAWRFGGGALAALATLLAATDTTLLAGLQAEPPILNALLPALLAPALLARAAALTLTRRREDAASRLLDAVAVVDVALFLSLEARHFLNEGDVFAMPVGLSEAGLQATLALLLSAGLLHVGRHASWTVFDLISLVLGTIGLPVAAIALLVWWNPMLTGEPVPGRPILNTLIVAYLVPALAAAAVGRLARGRRPLWYVALAYVVAGLLIFGWSTIVVRHVWHAPILSGPTFHAAELYAYSAVWVALGLAALLVGTARGVRPLRLAGLVLLGVAIAKVFLVDTAALEGVWRALSFLGLGAALIAVGAASRRLGRRPASVSGAT